MKNHWLCSRNPPVPHHRIQSKQDRTVSDDANVQEPLATGTRRGTYGSVVLYYQVLQQGGWPHTLSGLTQGIIYPLQQRTASLYPDWPHRQCVGLAYPRTLVRAFVAAASLAICSLIYTVHYVELRGNCTWGWG